MNKIILFGAGKYGKAAVKHYGLENISYFVDNNSTKWGTEIYGIPVLGIEQLMEETNLCDYQIIITCRVYKDIENQLKSLGINDYQLYTSLNEKRYYPTKELVLNPYEEMEDMTESRWNNEMSGNPLKKLMRLSVEELYDETPLFNHIEIETINRCNGICSFCPINSKIDPREKKIMSEKLFKSIISQLQDLNYAGKIALFSNNEPMLDERIIDFYEYAKKQIPNAWFFMFTNGTLLTLDKFKRLITNLDELIIDNYNQQLQLISNSKVIKNYCEEHWELCEKVTIVLRKPNEILSSRGGDAPNRKKLISYGEETCVLPFKQIIIRPDGKVSLCCNDPLGKNTLGDLTQETLWNIWYNENFKDVRKALYIGRKEWKHCKYCDVFNIG